MSDVATPDKVMVLKRKEQSIETLRGIAIILMVAGHVIGHDHTTGLLVADESIWRYLYKSLEHLRMPLFTAISGFVYAMKPLTRDKLGKFIGGKSRRILLPLFTVSSLQFVINGLVPNVNNPTNLNEIYMIYIYPYGQFWFLQALFFVFIVVIFLEYFNFITTFKGWTLAFGIAYLVLLIFPRVTWSEFFSFRQSFFLLPFFLLGIGLNRFHDEIFHKRVLIIVLSFLLAGITLQQLNWFDFVQLNETTVRFKGAIIGATAILLLFYFRKPFRPLAQLGFYSYGIYLFHVFGTAGSRIIAYELGVESLFILFFISLSFGLGIPVLIKMILLKSKFLRFFFLGLR